MDGGHPFAEARPADEATQSGAYLRSGGETDVLRLTRPGEAAPLVRSGAVDWVAVKTKFFAAVLIPDAPTEGAELGGERVGEPESPAFAEHFVARLEMPRPEAVAGSANAPAEAAAASGHTFRLYLGPMELRRLAAYDLGLYEMVDFGFGQTVTRPIAQYIIAPTFALLSSFVPSMGLVIILFALLVKLVLWPLTSASFRSAARMRELQPKMEAIKERHGDNPQKQQEEMLKLYREAGVNPLGGCLPMLLQYPILIALWQFFQSTMVLRQEAFLWAPDLSAPDPILHLPFAIPFYGDFVAGFTLIMGVSMIAQMRLSMPGGQMNAQNKTIMYMMPLLFFVFFNRFPSGLSLYYLAFNIFSIGQQRWVNARVHAEAVARANGTAPAPARNGRAATNGQPGARKKARRGA